MKGRTTSGQYDPETECVRVAIRIRPEATYNSALSVYDKHNVSFIDRNQESKNFSFDRIYDQDALQTDIFNEFNSLANSVIDGNNVSIIAYGQTGSGKSYTMIGTPQERGLSYSLAKYLLDLIGNDSNCSITYSMLEVYNNEIFDLLGDTKVPLQIQTNGGQTTVQNLTEFLIDSMETVNHLYEAGIQSRSTAASGVHDRSSRSHCIITIKVIRQENEFEISGKLNLVDLAGNERVSRSSATGIALEETKHINKSLSTLGKVVQALDNKSSHIPYRDCKLTFLLQDSLAYNCKVVMICTIRPIFETLDETANTLNFAARAKNIVLGDAKRAIKQVRNHRDYEVLQGKYNDLLKKYYQAEDENKNLVKEIETLKKNDLLSQRNAMKQHASIQHQLRMVKEDEANFQKIIKDLKMENFELRRQAAQHNKEITTLNNRITALKQDLELKQMRIKSVTKQELEAKRINNKKDTIAGKTRFRSEVNKVVTIQKPLTKKITDQDSFNLYNSGIPVMRNGIAKLPPRNASNNIYSSPLGTNRPNNSSNYQSAVTNRNQNYMMNNHQEEYTEDIDISINNRVNNSNPFSKNNLDKLKTLKRYQPHPNSSVVPSLITENSSFNNRSSNSSSSSSTQSSPKNRNTNTLYQNNNVTKFPYQDNQKGIEKKIAKEQTQKSYSSSSDDMSSSDDNINPNKYQPTVINEARKDTTDAPSKSKDSNTIIRKIPNKFIITPKKTENTEPIDDKPQRPLPQVPHDGISSNELQRRSVKSKNTKK